MYRILTWALLLAVILGCEESDPPEDQIDFVLTGTWAVTNMGIFENPDCSGALDYSYWDFIVGLGLEMSFSFNEDGSGIVSTVTPFGSEDQPLNWSLDADSLCIDDLCIAFNPSDQGDEIMIQQHSEAFCVDENGNETDDTNQVECILGGNTWFPETCYQFELTRME